MKNYHCPICNHAFSKHRIREAGQKKCKCGVLHTQRQLNVSYNHLYVDGVRHIVSTFEAAHLYYIYFHLKNMTQVFNFNSGSQEILYQEGKDPFVRAFKLKAFT